MAKQGKTPKTKQKPCSCGGAKAGKPHSRSDCKVLLGELLESQRIEATIAADYELRRRG